MKNITYIKNALFCLDDTLSPFSFEALVNGDYETQINIHLETTTKDFVASLDKEGVEYVKKCISEINTTNFELYN